MRRTYFIRNKAVLIGGLLVLGAGVWVNIKWLSSDPPASVTFYLINLLPGLLLLVSWLLASQFSRLRWYLIAFGLIVTLVAVVFAYLLNVMAFAWTAYTAPVQDAEYYEEALAQYDGSLVAHFPPHIPDSATQFTFYYLPAFLQGGSYLQLRCKLSPAEVESVLRQYRPIAKQVESGAGDVIEAMDEQNHLPATRFRNEENTEFTPLPEDFLVLILDAEPYKPANWNHGYTYGIAASTERHEVIYWAEHW